jgi:hypothetical protein
MRREPSGTPAREGGVDLGMPGPGPPYRAYLRGGSVGSG